MQPIIVEVVAPVLTGFSHCPHCETFLEGAGVGPQVHNQQVNEYPEEVKAEYLRISRWVQALRERYGERVSVRLVDPQSLLGFWRVLRHRIRRYPTFLVDGAAVAGWDGDPEGAISAALAHRCARDTLAPRRRAAGR